MLDKRVYYLENNFKNDRIIKLIEQNHHSHFYGVYNITIPDDITHIVIGRRTRKTTKEQSKERNIPLVTIEELIEDLSTTIYSLPEINLCHLLRNLTYVEVTNQLFEYLKAKSNRDYFLYGLKIILSEDHDLYYHFNYYDDTVGNLCFKIDSVEFDDFDEEIKNNYQYYHAWLVYIKSCSLFNDLVVFGSPIRDKLELKIILEYIGIPITEMEKEANTIVLRVDQRIPYTLADPGQTVYFFEDFTELLIERMSTVMDREYARDLLCFAHYFFCTK